MPASKRPSDSRSVTGKKSRKTLDKNEGQSNVYTGKSIFTKVIKECGVVLMNGQHSNLIGKDQNIFLKDFLKVIKRHEDFPEIVDDILEGIREYTEDEARFVRMMLTTDFLEDGDPQTSQKVLQDSVIRLLLKTQPLQMGVANLLIEKMDKYKEDSSIRLEMGPFNNQNETVNVPQLILNQLRWLDVVEDADSVAVKLLGAASVMSHQTACAIITSLPEIVGDEVHDNVAGKLEELLASNVDLAISILDTLCSLNCSSKAMENIKNTIFSCLRSVKIEELPVVVKFLLQTMDSENAEQNINCLRQHLTFSPATLSQNSQSSRASHRQGSEVTATKLTAEAILYAAQYRTFVADSWIKILKNSEFSSADWVTLLILCANYNTNSRKSATSLMKSKILSGAVDDTLIQLTFEECSDVLISYFSTISDLASHYVSSNSSSLQRHGAVLYRAMFSHLDNYCRQEVIGCLVQHVGSFCSSEVDAALEILQTLSVHKLPLLTPFTLFIRGILDHVERLTCRQVRLVYEVLSRLAFGRASNRAPTIEDELHMIIRKQLTHSSVKLKYIGIIGAVNMLKILGGADSGDDMSHEAVNSVLSLLDKSTCNYNKAKAFYLDELCLFFQHPIDPWLCKQISHLLCQKLEETFYQASIQEDCLGSSVFGLDNESDKPISIYEAVRSCDYQYSLLCPLFKATAKSRSRQKEKVVCLAKNPILLDQSTFDVKDFNTLPSARQKSILDGLFVTLNWFRENLNAFCEEKSHHEHALVRMDQIFKIEKTLENIVAGFPKYSPPVMISEFGESLAMSDTQGSSATQEALEVHISNSVNGACEATSSDAKKAKIPKKKIESSFNIAAIKPQYMRELHVDVLSLLQIPMGEDIFEEKVSITSDSEDDKQLFPRHLLFLLKDLKKKISYKLPVLDTEKKASPFSSTQTHIGFQDLEQISEKDFGEKVHKLLPYLCNHLESMNAPFTANGDDALEDMEIEKRHLLVVCYEYLLEVLFHAMSWRGMNNNGELLKSVLFSIGKRISSDVDGNSTIRNLMKAAFSYLQNFEGIVTRVSLQAATFLAKLLTVIAKFHEHQYKEEFNCDIHHFTFLMLKADWPSSAGPAVGPGGKRNEMLTYLLKLNIQTADETLKATRHFVDEGLCKIGQEDAPYPCFTKSNSHVLYACIFEILMEETGKIQAIKERDDENTRIELLLRWSDCMKVIGVITRFLREFHTRPNILTSLRCGKVIIENFIKNGMPTCEKIFHLYQDDVVSILKHLQGTTRQLQHLTCHSKVVKDISLAKQVPPLKKALETLLFRVKGMLALHNCQEAFWLGNLKNRNLQGEELLSQMTQRDNSEADNGEISSEYQDMSYSESY